MVNKLCTQCKEQKPLSKFHLRSLNKTNGRTCWCKKCSSEYRRNHYILNKFRLNRLARKWWNNNKNKMNEHVRKKYWEKIKYKGYETYLEKVKFKNFVRNKYIKIDFMNFTSRIYMTQIKSCKERGDEKPKYSLDDFRKWLLNQNKFDILLNDWEQCKFSYKKKPTIDRINPFETYSLENIQLLTIGENCTKARHDVKIVYQFLKNLYKKDKLIQKKFRKELLRKH